MIRNKKKYIKRNFPKSDTKRRKENKINPFITDTNRGGIAEQSLIFILLKNGINKHFIFHNLYVNMANGNFSQIDLVLLSTVGIIVFEVKNYNGWIFGNGKQDEWTKVLGKYRYKFYNPIKQNANHINILKSSLRKEIEEDIPFFSVIVFFGDSELKNINFVPEKTFITKNYRVLDVINNIIINNKKIAYKDTNKIMEILKKFVDNGKIWENRFKHVYHINKRLGKFRIYDF